MAETRAPERVILVPLESRALRLLVRIVLVLSVAWLAKVILSPALADSIVPHAAGLADLQRVVV